MSSFLYNLLLYQSSLHCGLILLLHAQYKATAVVSANDTCAVLSQLSQLQSTLPLGNLGNKTSNGTPKIILYL